MKSSFKSNLTSFSLKLKKGKASSFCARAEKSPEWCRTNRRTIFRSMRSSFAVMPLFTRRRLMTSVGALAALTGLGVSRAMPFTYHEGPETDHFDGVRFHDPNGMPPKSFADQWRWFRENNKAAWPKRVENE